MPLVRIDLARGKTEHYRRTIGDVVYDAMVATMNVPVNDRFQIIAEHSDNDFIIDKTYLGIERSDDCRRHSGDAQRGAARSRRSAPSTRRWRMDSTGPSICAARMCSSIWSRPPRKTGRSAMARRNTLACATAGWLQVANASIAANTMEGLSTMEYRHLGGSGFNVPVLSFRHRHLRRQGRILRGLGRDRRRGGDAASSTSASTPA